jgi:purine-cytosine permease-like protein
MEMALIKKMENDSSPIIKKGWNLYLYYWVIFALIFFIVLNYFSRNFMVEALNINLMISVVSFLFGFLITVTFSMILTRVSSLKDSLATETGRLVSLFLLSKNLGQTFSDKIKEIIDEYTIRTLRDYTNYEIGRDLVYHIYENLPLADTKTQPQNDFMASFLYILGEFETVREKLEYLTSRRIEKPLKFANFILGVLLIGLLFLNRGDLFTNILFIILSTMIVFILLILEDYDNLRIGDYTYNISNSEQIFDLIGKDRYYPKSVLGRVSLVKGKNYRIGFFNKKTGEEKIFNISYLGSPKLRLGALVKKLKRKV